MRICGENVARFKKLSVQHENGQGFGIRKGGCSSTRSREENRPFFLLEWPTSSTLPQVTQKPNAKNNVRLPCALQVFGYMELDFGHLGMEPL
jgi:hypothetical protein